MGVNEVKLEHAKQIIEEAWEIKEKITPELHGKEEYEAVKVVLNGLDSGQLRVSEKQGSSRNVNEWLKKAVLLSFRLNNMMTISGGPGGKSSWFDKIPSKF